MTGSAGGEEIGKERQVKDSNDYLVVHVPRGPDCYSTVPVSSTDVRGTVLIGSQRCEVTVLVPSMVLFCYCTVLLTFFSPSVHTVHDSLVPRLYLRAHTQTD